MRQTEPTRAPGPSEAVARPKLRRDPGLTALPPARLSPTGVLALQRSAGNRAVGRMLARCSGATCNCGGRCHGDHDPPDEEQARRQP
jgi:hypothetical protein